MLTAARHRADRLSGAYINSATQGSRKPLNQYLCGVRLKLLHRPDGAGFGEEANRLSCRHPRAATAARARSSAVTRSMVSEWTKTRIEPSAF
jgi:hypothetical protein